MNVLVFAPHNDDEVLGVGGTIAKHIIKGDNVYICEVTSSLVKERKQLLQDEALRVHSYLGIKETIFLDFTVVELPHEGIREFNRAISDTVQRFKPDIVYIPFYGDMHADHTAVCNSVLVAVRPIQAPFVSKIYMYETLSETGWNLPTVDKTFIPNVFIDITETIDVKKEAMLKYESQIKVSPHPRSLDTIEALAQFRGNTVGVKYAEAFMCVRTIER